jgi:hypothetical protein
MNHKANVSIQVGSTCISCSQKIEDPAVSQQLMLTDTWDFQGPILQHYQEQGTTVTCARYSYML